MPILPLFFNRVLEALATAEVDVFQELSWYFDEKVGLKLNTQKMKIMASCPITS